MRPDFLVQVYRDSHPLSGVAVKVASSNGEARFSETTDETGEVHVTNLAPGDYWIRVSLLGISAGEECFHVDRGIARGEKRLRYEWGVLAVGVSGVAGSLSWYKLGIGGTPTENLVHQLRVAASNISLILTNPFTKQTFEATSDADGHFSFSDITPGIYVLHTTAEDGHFDASDILLELSPGRGRQYIPLVARRNTCGTTSFELDFQSKEPSR